MGPRRPDDAADRRVASARVPDETIVVSQDLAEHYLRAYGRPTTWIPNGVDEPTVRRPAMIARSVRTHDRVVPSSPSAGWSRRRRRTC